ncbi:TetR/AcrR family transcriptional regulator [Amycolatopsis oliviviridis]|uniref:Transcriptional regulatory protein TetR n=1 Tax=Amycolatopsis oliviviridis TaxID=1471590 RepID=A0ABQ3LE03_9PSEU|nr:TetR/AcrR family transcriptional regulator [Amycolatopsis oliviviridis]GHH05321.1 putative transcriptional regulatory protein TetR [Amycolatopsis oliviviridis]
MTETSRPLRADARRNRERITQGARELFARRGREVQMDEIAEYCGLGIGTLYRHFPNKEALLTALVRERFEGMAELARVADKLADPQEAFEEMLRTYLEAADGDAIFQLALMGSTDFDWEAIEEEKHVYAEILARIIERAAQAGAVRADFGLDDFRMLVSSIMATMYFSRGEPANWRRHLDLVLDGVRPRPER